MFDKKGPTFFELAHQALSSTKRGYDLLAPKFDYTPFKTPDFLINTCLEQLKPFGPFERAADICTGTGAVIDGLIPIVKNQIVGIDWSLPMLLEAKKKFETVTSPNISLVFQDMYAIELPKKFDLVTTFGSLGHIEKHRYQEFVDKMASILHPGGLFVFVTSERPSLFSPLFWMAFTFDSLMKLRNFFHKPEFIMYYLNFLLPEILPLFHNGDWEGIQIIPLKLSDNPTLLKMIIAKKTKTP